jgi:tripartite-type tricarboxylate transporter receptor subunit TctC
VENEPLIRARFLDGFRRVLVFGPSVFARARVIVCVTALATACVPPAAEPYAGKTMRLLIGTGFGGTLDLEARLFARHLSRHLPGAPRIVVESVPGAGGLILLNLLNTQVAPDGLTLAYLTVSPVVAQLFGGPSYGDVRRLGFIGAPHPDNTVCAFSAASGVRSMADWRARPQPVRLGSVSPDSITTIFPKLVAAVLNVPVQVVTGYDGASEIRLAVATRELDGQCGSWSTIKTGASSIDGFSVVLQGGHQPLPDLLNVPFAAALADSAEGRELLDRSLSALAAAGRFYVLPPGARDETRDTLRGAFMDVMTDPQFLADARSAGISIDPIAGDEIERNVGALLSMPDRLADRLRRVLGR